MDLESVIRMTKMIEHQYDYIVSLFGENFIATATPKKLNQKRAKQSGISILYSGLNVASHELALQITSEITFNLQARVRLLVKVPGKFEEHRFSSTVGVKWGSGGSDYLITAFAEAKHNLDLVEKACMASEVLRDLANKLNRMPRDEALAVISQLKKNRDKFYDQRWWNEEVEG